MTQKIPIGDDRAIHLKERFRATALSRLKSEAPSIVEGALSVFRDSESFAKLLEEATDRADGELGEDELAELREQYAARTTMESVRQGVQLTIEDAGELDALHRFCVEVTDRVDGFEDASGDPIVWKHLDERERLDFYDFDVPNQYKVWIFIYAYSQKAGIG